MASIIRVCILSALAFVTFTQETEAWELRDSDGSVKIYSKVKQGSGIPTLKGTVTIPLSSDSVGQVLTDLKNHYRFVPHMKSIKVIEESVDAQGVVFQLLHQINALPVIDDRDVVLDTKTWRSETDGKVSWQSTFKAVANRGPKPTEDMVRIPSMTGAWGVSPGTRPDTCKVTYITHVEVGGLVPDTLAEHAQVSALAELLEALRSHCVTLSKK